MAAGAWMPATATSGCRTAWPSGWAPYRDGHWAWVAPWGWTWVDDAPWGFAVSHYGRWANLGGTWGWVPGPVRMQAVYAPALVAFVGGSNFQLSISSGPVGGIAWFPLAPREVYRPSYTVSRDYYERINRSNTVVNNTVIQNTYNTTNVTNIVYANRRVPGAVVAVPTTTFVQSQPVSRAAVRVSTQTLRSAPVTASRMWRPPNKAFVAPPPEATSRRLEYSSVRSLPTPHHLRRPPPWRCSHLRRQRCQARPGENVQRQDASLRRQPRHAPCVWSSRRKPRRRRAGRRHRTPGPSGRSTRRREGPQGRPGASPPHRGRNTGRTAGRNTEPCAGADCAARRGSAVPRAASQGWVVRQGRQAPAGTCTRCRDSTGSEQPQSPGRRSRAASPNPRARRRGATPRRPFLRMRQPRSL